MKTVLIFIVLLLSIIVTGCAKKGDAPAPITAPAPCLADADMLNGQLVSLINQAKSDQDTIDLNTAWIVAHPGSPGIIGHQNNINVATADLLLVNAAITQTQERLLTPACAQ